MKRFIRFMSEKELEKFLEGEPLVNEKVHDGRIKGSVGFCFFDAEDIGPITAHHVLSGIATLQYMVEFVVEDDVAERILKKSKGVYHLPKDPLYKGTILTEYCTTSYSRDDFMPYQIWHLMVSYSAVFQGGRKMSNLLCRKSLSGTYDFALEGGYSIANCGVGKDWCTVYLIETHPDFRGKGEAQKLLLTLKEKSEKSKKKFRVWYPMNDVIEHICEKLSIEVIRDIDREEVGRQD